MGTKLRKILWITWSLWLFSVIITLTLYPIYEKNFCMGWYGSVHRKSNYYSLINTSSMIQDKQLPRLFTVYNLKSATLYCTKIKEFSCTEIIFSILLHIGLREWLTPCFGFKHRYSSCKHLLVVLLLMTSENYVLVLNFDFFEITWIFVRGGF